MNPLSARLRPQAPATPALVRVKAGKDASLKSAKSHFGMSPDVPPQMNALNDSLYKPPAFSPISNLVRQRTLEDSGSKPVQCAIDIDNGWFLLNILIPYPRSFRRGWKPPFQSSISVYDSYQNGIQRSNGAVSQLYWSICSFSIPF